MATSLAVLIASPALSHDWYPKSCCSDTDCRRTRPTFEDDVWKVYIQEIGEWRVVPSDKIRRDIVPPDGGCHVCYRYIINEVFIYCFFPCGAGT